MSVFGGGATMGGHRRIERIHAPLLRTTKFSVAFSGTENPMVGDGGWKQGLTDGLDWNDVATNGSYAYSRQYDHDVDYSDATAIRTGTWANDQWASVVARNTDESNVNYREMTIRLRSAVSAHVNSGYEVTATARTSQAGDGFNYLLVVKFNGTIGSFTSLYNPQGTQYSLQDGDTFTADIVGTTIRAWVRGVQVATVDTLVDINGNPLTGITSGNPGIGFFHSRGLGFNTVLNNSYGLKSFQAGEYP